MNTTSITDRGRIANTNGARASNGVRPATIEVGVLDFKHYEKNTLSGFLECGAGLLVGDVENIRALTLAVLLVWPSWEANPAAVTLFMERAANDLQPGRRQHDIQKAACATVDAYLREVDPLHRRSL